MCKREILANGISPRPETFTEASTHRADKVRIRVVMEESFEHVHINRSVNLKKVWVVSNGFRGDGMRKVEYRGARKRTSSFRPLCRGLGRRSPFLP
jgi:hypothetical protein